MKLEKSCGFPVYLKQFCDILWEIINIYLFLAPKHVVLVLQTTKIAITHFVLGTQINQWKAKSSLITKHGGNYLWSWHANHWNWARVSKFLADTFDWDMSSVQLSPEMHAEYGLSLSLQFLTLFKSWCVVSNLSPTKLPSYWLQGLTFPQTHTCGVK